MTGFLIRKDYRIGQDAHWAYLQRRPYDGAWLWTGGSDTATVISPVVAQQMATALARQEDGISIVPDYYFRQPTVLQMPDEFKVAA